MTERSESERAELVALADRLAVFTKYGPSTIFEQHLSGNQLQLIVTALRSLAAQDQKPVADNMPDHGGADAVVKAQIATLAQRFWTIHPRELQDKGMTREDFYIREMTALVASLSKPAPVAANASAVLQNDLAEMLRALGMSDAAQPKSPHEVFQSALAEMKRQIANASAEARQKECFDLAAKEPCPDCPHPVTICASTKSEGGVEGHAIPRTTSATTTRYPATEGEEHMVAPARRTEEQSSTKTGQAGIKPGPSDRTADDLPAIRSANDWDKQGER